MIETIKRRIACLLNGHDLWFRRNIYGDEIIMRGWMRSEHECLRCGAIKYKPELRKP